MRPRRPASPPVHSETLASSRERVEFRSSGSFKPYLCPFLGGFSSGQSQQEVDIFSAHTRRRLQVTQRGGQGLGSATGTHAPIRIPGLDRHLRPPVMMIRFSILVSENPPFNSLQGERSGVQPWVRLGQQPQQGTEPKHPQGHRVSSRLSPGSPGFPFSSFGTSQTEHPA